MAIIAYKGNIITAPEMDVLECARDSYLVAEDGIIKGVFSDIYGFPNAELKDYGDAIITPSFCDMHLHAPQYTMMGIGTELTLLEWLEQKTYETESRFKDSDYARMIYAELASKLLQNGTTHVCIYSSLHLSSSIILAETLQSAGIRGYVGKVNMDISSYNGLSETASASLTNTEAFIESCFHMEKIKPIITPRFIPSCSDELLSGLGKMARERGVRVQSHLSETKQEIELVKALHPDCRYYYQVYEKYGLFRRKDVMAHGVYSCEAERIALKKAGVLLAHCPTSNINLRSGIAPIRQMLDEGVFVALGSDIAGGQFLCMLRVAQSAIAASKLRSAATDGREAPLSTRETFYMLTTAGQLYFGEEAGFTSGIPLHALVLTDKNLPRVSNLTPEERLERIIDMGGEENIEKVLL